MVATAVILDRLKKNAFIVLSLGSISMIIPYFFPNRMNGIRSQSRYVFFRQNNILNPECHLYENKLNVLQQAYFQGKVLYPCYILSKSDKQDPNAVPKCDFWGLWLIFLFITECRHLEFCKKQKFLQRLVFMVESHAYANFCLNWVNGICFPSHNVNLICTNQANSSAFWGKTINKATWE